MMQAVKIQEAIGKTLANVAFSLTCSQAVLTFTDGTFTTLCATGQDRLEIEAGELNLEAFGDKELIRVGITTAAALADLCASREEIWKELRERNERQEFARLKRKFEA